ncbi:MAG: ImmA/IrrE family metallo-endopeptidase [Clostridium sp.]|nr:ImmA/IrrE family metallo-endopeptidase [Clostridium sp.]
MDDKEKKVIEKVAKKIKSKLYNQFGIKDFRDPFKVISSLDGYIIIRFKNDKKIQGFTIKKENYKCIYINSADVLGRQYYSCWHEFYHSIDDVHELRISHKGDKSVAEESAEYFAGCMLLDKDELNRYIRIKWGNENNLNEEALIDIQYKFQVSFEALKVRLNEIFNTKRFYKFKINSIENRKKYEKKVRQLGYDIQLISPTEDFCVPYFFIEDLQKNLIGKRMSMEKISETINFLEEKEVKFKW